jgi:transposase
MDENDRLLDDSFLPDNLPECHRLIKDLRTRIKSLEERLAELEKQVGRRNRMLFGKRSAKTSNSVLTGTGKAVYDTNAQELEDARNDLQLVPEEHKNGGGGRTGPKTAPTETPIEHTLSDLSCPCCGTARKVVGFQVSHQLDIVQAVFQLLKHIQYTYSCPKCHGEMVTAPKPDQLIDKGYPSEGLIAHIGNSKFSHHLPLYRQQQIYRAQSISIARSSMCRWLKHAADMFEVIVERMHQRILQSRFIQSDSSVMPVIKKGLGRTHRGTIWILRGDGTQPYLIYEFTETGEARHIERMLAGFRGILLTDGAPVFNIAIENGATAANCWAHAYRYFEDARDSEQELSDYAMAIIKGLFDIERVAALLDEDERLQLRQRLSKPRLASLKQWLQDQTVMLHFLPKSKFGEAINYCLNRWDALCRFTDTGFLPADNNHSENGLRPAVLGRKNWLFAGSVEGGRTAAIFMSIIQTCKRLAIDPFEYMRDVLTRLPATKTSDIDEFLPDRWKQLRKETH